MNTQQTKKTSIFVLLLLLLLIVVADIIIVPKSNWKKFFNLNKTADVYSPETDFSTSSPDGIHITITGYTGAGGDVNIPPTIGGKSVTKIGDDAFASKNSITSVIIPSGVTNIGKEVFMNDNFMTSVTIPSGVTNIDNNAFDHDVLLTSITVPDSVTNIGVGAFAYDSSLTSVVLGSGLKTIGMGAFTYCTSLTSINIPEGVITLGDGAFAYNYSLTSIVFPSTLHIIGIAEFQNCTSLTSVIIPSVISIGTDAFSGCSKLSSIIIPNILSTIGVEGFKNCSSLTSMFFLGNSPSSVGASAFSGVASSFESYHSSSSIGWANPWQGYPSTTFLPSAKSIISFNIVSPVATGTIAGTNISISVPFGTDVSNLVATFATDLGDTVSVGSTIQQSGTTANDFTNPVTYTVKAADSSTQNYTVTVNIADEISDFDYTVSSSTVTITGYHGTSTDITIPSTLDGYPVTSIGTQAFAFNNTITNIIIPDSITNIGEGAFDGMNLITEMDIPSSVTSIDAYALSDCPNLTQINVSPDNLKFSSQDGVLFNKDKTDLIQYPSGISGSYVIPDGVVHIFPAAFRRCSLTSVVIPDSVTEIGSGAFNHCGNLTNATIGSGFISMEDYFFDYCPNLIELHFSGDAPGILFGASHIFDGGDPPFTIYYLSSKSGWTNPWYGHTALPEDTKSITSFIIASSTGSISETDHTISATVPFGTDVSNLIATFTTTGSSVSVGSTTQVSGVTANDFTSSVTYTVTAFDNSTKDYTVTVTVEGGGRRHPIPPSPTPSPEPSPVTPTCNTYWYFDNTSLICQQKQFCGEYMYQGLQTFNNQSDCQSALPTISTTTVATTTSTTTEETSTTTSTTTPPVVSSSTTPPVQEPSPTEPPPVITTVTPPPSHNPVHPPTNNPQSPVNGIINQTPTNTFIPPVITEAITAVTPAFTATKQIINTPAVSTVTKTLTTAGVVAGAGVSIAAVAVANPITFSELWLIPGKLFGLLMGALGIRRKAKKWGTVYDSITKRPLDPVYVSLINTETNKEVASAITDIDGRYGFLVLPGTYKIVAKKTNYTSPSMKMKGRSFDEVYNDLYFGEEIVITNEAETITKNIPMDSMSFDWNEFAKTRMDVNTFMKKKDITIAKVSNFLFSFGSVIALIGLIFAPEPYNFIIFGLYILTYILNYFVWKTHKAGRLTEKATNLPLSFAIVKIFRAGETTPLVKKVADKYGDYYSLVPNGRYYMEVDRKNDDETYTEVLHTADIDVKGGIINFNMQL